MPLSDSELKALKAGAKRKVVSAGDSLFVVVESVGKGGGKSFIGRTRFPPGRSGKQVEVRIGPYGRGAGKWTLKAAREKWESIRTWSRETGRDPRELSRGQPGEDGERGPSKTLQDAIDGFLDSKRSLKEFTLTNYRRQLQNQVTDVIPAMTPLRELEWDRGGRAKVKELVAFIEDRGSYDQAFRVQKVLAQALDYAILQGWMPRNQNPATKQKGEESKHDPKHHPHIEWEQVPELLQAINLNRCSGHVQAVLALKFLLMTFLRTGALARLEWKWISKKDNLLVIPGSTPGLKRTKKTEHLDHHVPLTKEMNALLKQAKQMNGDLPYVFGPVREHSRYPHLDPESPNNLLKALGYRGVLRAHGWRSLPLTAGQEVLKAPHDIIQRQMGHLIGDKVRKAYDKSLMLEERREFLEQWCALLVKKGLKI